MSVYECMCETNCDCVYVCLLLPPTAAEEDECLLLSSQNLPLGPLHRKGENEAYLGHGLKDHDQR